ncbi:OmpA family protein [Riemerella columbina]|uniref:OmpA family protein n=1 Tax=Riemerella columbina TaxID=103810 RepID=UPI00035C708E|nr:OmpA family protein [Riemerella columbina]
MKKYIFAIATLSFVVSCQKIQPGGNKSILKQGEDTETYYDDHRGSGEAHGEEGHHATTAAHKDAVEVTVIDGVTLHGFKNGLEERMVAFLKSGKYDTETEEGLKSVWYDFDNVNFKMGSSTELISGESQIDNLAKILKVYPDVKIKIGGYTDKTGNEATNKKISQQRAEYIKSQLEKAGVGNQVISAEGYGSQYAEVSADASNEERASDRKMAVRFTK